MVVSKIEVRRSLTDLQVSDYLKFPLPHDERVKHLESWLREALILPFAYNASIDKQGHFVSFGQKMVEINEHAVEVRKGQVGEERVRAEMDGVIRLEELLNQAEPGDLLFLFSPPGSTEEGFGSKDQRRLSFTYIFEVGEGKGDDQKSVRAIAIPAPEISPLVQMKQFSDIFVEEQMTALTSLSVVGPIDRKLVATPILISKLTKEERNQKLEKYVNAYIGKSWGELEQTLDNGLRLQNDEHAEARRKSLIQSISWQIRRYVDEKDGFRLNNIGEAARVVLAREASAHYVNSTPEQLLEEYQKTESAMWVQLKYKLASVAERRRTVEDFGSELFIANKHLQLIREAIERDPNTTGILAGSSCGGGGLGNVLDGTSSKFGDIMTGSGHILELQLGRVELSSEQSSSGEMKCVTCPFCSKLVDAIVTSDKIVCPSCHKSASRG